MSILCLWETTSNRYVCDCALIGTPFVLLPQVFDACGVEFNVRIWIAILVPLVTVFCWIRNFDSLAPLSTVANLCILFGLGVILYDIFHLIDERKAAIFEHPSIKQWPAGGLITIVTALAVFFGNSIYAFEGIGVVRNRSIFIMHCVYMRMLLFKVLPLENKIKHPHHFTKVICLAMGSITVLYAVFGTLGYLAFGDDIDDSITLNLPGDKHLHSV